MLAGLSIRDVVLIEALDVELGQGLSVLTGETGAGKSILLDALGLALGARGDRGLVRPGAERGSVTAVFALEPGHPALSLLDEAGIEPEDQLVLRRVLGADGRSRAFVNDRPVGTQLLRRLGQDLVEVHGQHEQQALLDARTHRMLLDAFGGLQPPASQLRAAHAAWRAAEARRAELADELARLREEEEYLRHTLEELQRLAPELGEEEALAETRTRLMGRDKLQEVVQEALQAIAGALDRLGTAQRRLERQSEAGGGILSRAVECLERALVETGETQGALEEATRELESGEASLDAVEERLFALRALARKHRCAVDELPAVTLRSEEALAAIDHGGERLDAAAEAASRALDDFRDRARALSAGRAEAGAALAAAISRELPPLRLDKARFRVALATLDEADWTAEGAERVAFEVATNPGQPFGPIGRIASGGELARFMLALKVVLARIGSTPSVVFDEIDTGIGGATADAVGERLARLGREVQVLVVTHAPQVAARAERHFRVGKLTLDGGARVEVEALDDAGRREELARMLAGARITRAARAAADSLLDQAS
jgi:DNA repair protein RecN (Recombination protein N)